MNEIIGRLYSKAYLMINDMIVCKLSLRQRKELQEILKQLLDSESIEDSDKENFRYWYGNYDNDIGNIKNAINEKIQKELAVIEIAQRKIKELEEQLILSH